VVYKRLQSYSELLKKKPHQTTSDRPINTKKGKKLYQLWFLMPQKIKNLTMVNADPPAWLADASRADIDIKEQIERSEDMRHFIS
jgi:hypothetical protein